MKSTVFYIILNKRINVICIYVCVRVCEKKKIYIYIDLTSNILTGSVSVSI